MLAMQYSTFIIWFLHRLPYCRHRGLKCAKWLFLKMHTGGLMSSKGLVGVSCRRSLASSTAEKSSNNLDFSCSWRTIFRRSFQRLQIPLEPYGAELFSPKKNELLWQTGAQQRNETVWRCSWMTKKLVTDMTDILSNICKHKTRKNYEKCPECQIESY